MNQHKKERYAAANFKVILKQFPFPIPIIWLLGGGDKDIQNEQKGISCLP